MLLTTTPLRQVMGASPEQRRIHFQEIPLAEKTDQLSIGPNPEEGRCSICLQRLLIDRPADRRALYWRETCGRPGESATEVAADGSLHVPPGRTVSFDTYFNSFFESLWRAHTALDAVVLRLTLGGSGTVRVFRRALDRRTPVHERRHATGSVEVRLPDEAINFRQVGTLAVELTAGMEGLQVIAGAWHGTGPAAAVGLAAVFCTFNREAEIDRLVGAVAADEGARRCLRRVIVVNQGRPGLRLTAAAAFGPRLQMIEQANLGGAGGFGCGLLEALSAPDLTHVVLLDDDVLLEPDSLLRAAAFFSLSRQPLVLGGHMLDLLRPQNLYEAGSVIGDRHWSFQPQQHETDLASPGCLEHLSRPNPVHYNGWWFCGFPVAVLQDHGMPMPCFIRGDDVEFGLRLHNRGVPTVPMPGIAVWHEPFYVKLAGWQIYYETRNMLILAALHMPDTPASVVRRVARHVVRALLTFNYYTASLLLAAVADYIRGPAVLQADPRAQHAALGALREQFPAQALSRNIVAQRQMMGRRPKTPLGYLTVLAWLTVRGAMVPNQAAAPKLVEARELDWPAMRGVDHVVVESWWQDARPVFRRCHRQHRTILRAAIPLLWRLYRRHAAVSQTWRAGMGALTGVTFWRSYLKAFGRAAEQ